MRISDWSSDVCSSDLIGAGVDVARRQAVAAPVAGEEGDFDAVDATDEEFVGRLAPGRVDGDPLRALERIRCVEAGAADDRSEERRVGQECVRTCRSRWSPYT